MAKKYVVRHTGLGDGAGGISHRLGNILEEKELPPEMFSRFLEIGAIAPATDEDIAAAAAPPVPVPEEEGPSLLERVLDLEARVDVLEAGAMSEPASVVPEEGKKK